MRDIQTGGKKHELYLRKGFFAFIWNMLLEPRWRPQTIWPQERQDSGREESPGKGSEKLKRSGGVGEGTRSGREEEDVRVRCSKRIWTRKFLPTVSRMAGQKPVSSVLALCQVLCCCSFVFSEITSFCFCLRFRLMI